MFKMNILLGRAAPARTLPPGGGTRGRQRRGGATPPLPRPTSRQGLRPPRPSHRVGAWGNRVSPSPCARAAPSPSRGGGVGKPGLPMPLLQQPMFTLGGVRPGNLRAGDAGAGGVGAGNPAPTPARLQAGAAPSQTFPPGGGMGKPGFPTPLRKGCALTFPGRGRGETRFPHTPAPAAYVHVRCACAPGDRAGAGAPGHRPAGSAQSGRQSPF